MEAVMKDVEYTKEDLKALAAMCTPGSAIPLELELMGYNPDKFKEYIKVLPTHYRFIYQVPLEDAFMEINNPTIQRLFNWRTSIGK
jgi:hypothetical protein